MVGISPSAYLKQERKMKTYLKSTFLKVATLGILAMSLSTTSAVADTELVMSSWLPAKHPIVVNAFKPWAKQISEVTDGRVTVRILSKPLGAPPAHYDMAVDGVADITYGLHSFTKDDRFKRSRIGQFSFIGNDAESGSTAFWNVYTENLDAQAEHKGAKLLGLFVHGPGILHTKDKKISQPSDLEGLKIRTPGGYIADMMKDQGASTLFMSSGEVFEKLSRGVIDGVTFTYEAITAFKLTDHINHSMRIPGGIYNTTWFVVANQKKWDSISKEDQAAIEAISGPAFASLIGKAWNDADTKAIVVMEKADIEIYDASPEMLESISGTAKQLEADWVKSIAGDGFDGEAALVELRKQSKVAK